MPIVNSRMRHFVVRQQCKENQLLHFRGNTEPFYVVDGHIYANNKKGTYCCISWAKVVTRTRHKVTLYIVFFCVKCMVTFVRVIISSRNFASHCIGKPDSHVAGARAVGVAVGLHAAVTGAVVVFLSHTRPKFVFIRWDRQTWFATRGGILIGSRNTFTNLLTAHTKRVKISAM